MDRERQSGWVRLRLDIQEVREFRFEMGRTQFDVMSSGIQFGWRNGLIYVVLDAYPDDGDDLPNLATNIAYAAGKSCDLAVSDEPPG